MADVFLGIDVGSTTVKVVVLTPQGGLLAHRYVRANGQPRVVLLRTAREVLGGLPPVDILGVGLSGSGGRPMAEIIGGIHTNELVTQTRAVGEFHPEARTVIEIGGQDSKFLSVKWDEASRQMVLVDFAMNALCAAGTGSFLDQQAERLGIAIDGDFARIALESESPARIAGRCTVFAKSDMIHLQQEGTPLSDILMGLCHALARNFRSVIGKGKSFTPPILFQGGVAHNAAVARAFQDVLGLQAGELIVPERHDLMAALGAAWVAMDEHAEGRLHPFHGFDALEAAIRSPGGGERTLPALAPRPCAACRALQFPPSANGHRHPVWLGVDVGSISTNVVLVDEAERVVARRYLPTAGRPLEAVRRGLAEVAAEVGDVVRVVAAGCTGSGRYLTGHYVGADVIRNEITAQARAAVAVDPDVDTVFEIGGQDSEYIRLDRGAVVDFAMNNACAAGTGSFLEEQAARLDISIEGEFQALALSAPAPACLGERCTVFMESDLIHHQQRGARAENLTAGLAYSIVHNYMNRVVNTRPVGKRIFFQGGVAHNAAVASAFEAALGRSITVPPHHDVTGAIGVALLAREELARHPERRTRFRGFDATGRDYESRSFVCKACPNLCEVKKVTIAGEAPLFYGARCERFDEAGRNGTAAAEHVPDLFAERQRLLVGSWAEPGERVAGRTRIGIPRSLAFHDLFPWWRTFFAHLGMDVVLSSETNSEIVRRTAQTAAAETCYPVKLAFGHVAELLEKDVDFVFLPSILDREDLGPGQVRNHNCPWIPAAPHMVAAHLRPGAKQPRYLMFPFHMQQPVARRRELGVLAGQLGVSRRRVLAAAARGDAAQAEFYAALHELGRSTLASLGPGRTGVVVVGRPYNTCDLGVCQDLPRKLRKLGVLPIPMDLLTGMTVDLGADHKDMYWRSGQAILGTARLMATDPRLQAIYLTSFHCGPDSFLLSYFRREMGGKPFLELEVDDHTAEAGIVTRCEAFLDSLHIEREVA
ncbi:MAG TPA: acyl-CoA dehydratase activase [Longimicrobiales bacterium]|nr:acyl-CoA dehydratase activase [Longimicrobiales bacterium]